MKVWTIVVAGGSGARFGRRKQFSDIAGRSVLEHSVSAARSVSAGVVVVVPADSVEAEHARLASDHADPVGESVVWVVAGGATRSASVRAGMAAVPADSDIICVHDAARPLATVALFAAVIDAVEAGADAALPAIAVRDTIRHRAGGVVDRDELLAVQTPQAFRSTALRAAHRPGAEATDDASLVEAAGGTIVVVEGERTNLKITVSDDLVVAAALLGRTEVDPLTDTGADAPVPRHQADAPFRIGHGYDVHRFSDDPARLLRLGGVTFEGERALHGHSDADAVAHACIDAIAAAAGLGDIGQLFPETDPTLAGIDSMVLLVEAVRQVHAAGWAIGNVDATVVCEAPKISPRRAEMEHALSEVLDAAVTIKGKRPEGLGALGRREGIACSAVALLFRQEPS